jgi:hypothetical protein
MATQSPKYALAEVVDGYFLRKFNQRRKYFGNYLQIAQDVYKVLYRNILPTIKSKYVKVYPADANNPYPFVYLPDNFIKFYGASVTNKNGDLIEVVYNAEMNVFTKPAENPKGCGCSNSVCDCVDNLQVVMTEKVIDGTTYYQKDWVVCCDNGDVKQYSEIPVKKYGTDGGSFSDDYGDDYDIVSDGTNVVVIQVYKNLGRLETKDCGCPIESDNNKNIIFNKCGCFLGLKPDCCKIWYDKNIQCTGEMKFSECGGKLYLKNVKDDGGYVVISGQIDPAKCDEEIEVDDWAREAVWFGMDYQSIVFVPTVPAVSKKEAERRWMKAQTDLFIYLNPINSSRFFAVPTATQKW